MDKNTKKIECIYEILNTLNITGSIEPIRGGIENTLYLIKTDNENYVLKIYQYRTYKDVEFELSVLDILNKSKSNLIFPNPIYSKINKRIFLINNCHSVIYPFINGTTIKSYTRGIINQIVSFIVDFELSQNNLPLIKNSKGWEVSDIVDKSDLIIFKRSQLNINLITSSLIVDELKNVSIFEKALSEYNKSIIHGDLTMNNILLGENENVISIIDFDDAYFDFNILELSTFARSCCFNEKNEFMPKECEYLLSLYMDKKNILINKIEFLYILRYTCFKFFIYILYHDKFVRMNQIENHQNDFQKLNSIKNFLEKI